MYNLEIINSIRDKLMDAKETIAVAESVTSGHLQAALSMADNASLFFQGGITTYNLGQKCRHLNIEPVHAEACNSVSAEIASLMANNVCNLFISNWGIGICGYATTMPEKGIDELFAYYAIAYKGKTIRNRKITTAKEDTTAVQIFFATKALQELDQLIRQPVSIESK